MREEIKMALKKVKGDWFEEEKNLISGGYIDSFELVKLIKELERTFNVKIQVANIKPENFENLDRIVEVIESVVD